MPKTFWIIGLVLLMATANIEGTPCSTIDVTAPASPSFISWVAITHQSEQASMPSSCVDNNLIIHAIGRRDSGYQKCFSAKVVRTKHCNLSCTRPPWSLIHAPIYPSEVSRI